MTQREKVKQLKSLHDWLTMAVVDFMYLVRHKNDNESEEAHHKRVDEKYKELNKEWKLKCIGVNKAFAKEKSSAFADSISLIVADANKSEVAGINAPLREITPKQEAKIIKLLN